MSKPRSGRGGGGGFDGWTGGEENKAQDIVCSRGAMRWCSAKVEKGARAFVRWDRKTALVALSGSLGCGCAEDETQDAEQHTRGGYVKRSKHLQTRPEDTDGCAREEDHRYKKRPW